MSTTASALRELGLEELATEVEQLVGQAVDLAVAKADLEAAERERDEAVVLLREYESWEADMVLDSGVWRHEDGLPHLTQHLQDKLQALAKKRNAFLEPVKEPQHD